MCASPNNLRLSVDVPLSSNCLRFSSVVEMRKFNLRKPFSNSTTWPVTFYQVRL